MTQRARNGALAAAAFISMATLAGLAAGAVASSPPPAFVNDTSLTTGIGADGKGGCDQAARRSDPACVGIAPVRATPTSRASATPGASARPTAKPSPSPRRTSATSSSDLSGPCDEAEHANDPRCTGVPTRTGSTATAQASASSSDDSSGSGSDSSGPGSGDSSGSGSGSGGSGGSGGSDDSSGSGSGGSDDSSGSGSGHG